MDVITCNNQSNSAFTPADQYLGGAPRQRLRRLRYCLHDNPGSPLLKKWIFLSLGIFLVSLIFVAVFIFYKARHSEVLLRKFVENTLSEQFHSNVELQDLHVRVSPRLSVEGRDLTVHYHGRMDVAPLIHIEHFSFHIGLIGVLRPTKHIPVLIVRNMTITIPPRRDKTQEQKEQEAHEKESTGAKPKPAVIVDEIICNDTDIFISPRQRGKIPLDWEIHGLVLNSVSPDKPFTFQGNLTNAKPKGEIETHGDFGPWNVDEPGDTPVSGSFDFTDANLDPFPGIAGTLSSKGKYEGVLNELRVTGGTDTPNFRLDKVGKPVQLHTEYDATVDGTNGNTLLHPVRATLVNSLIIAEGSVSELPDKKGKEVTLDVTTPNAKIQDILNLAMNTEKPLLTGPVKIKVKLIVPPGKVRAVEKIILDGQFGVDDAKWTSPEVREKLEALSRRAQGKPEDEDAGNSISDLKGSFHMEKGVIEFHNLTFSVPGAVIDLKGTYAVVGGELDLSGHLRLQAKLSQTMTGVKSFLVKAFDPFFSKNGAGTELPIKITGTREQPVFGVSVFHKQIKKPIGGAEDQKGRRFINRREHAQPSHRSCFRAGILPCAGGHLSACGTSTVCSYPASD